MIRSIFTTLTLAAWLSACTDQDRAPFLLLGAFYVAPFYTLAQTPSGVVRTLGPESPIVDPALERHAFEFAGDHQGRSPNPSIVGWLDDDRILLSLSFRPQISDPRCEHSAQQGTSTCLALWRVSTGVVSFNNRRLDPETAWIEDLRATVRTPTAKARQADRGEFGDRVNASGAAKCCPADFTYQGAPNFVSEYEAWTPVGLVAHAYHGRSTDRPPVYPNHRKVSYFLNGKGGWRLLLADNNAHVEVLTLTWPSPDGCRFVLSYARDTLHRRRVLLLDLCGAVQAGSLVASR
jgi:hypothetical protein